MHVFDIETNGFLDVVTKGHCIALGETGHDKRPHLFTNIDEALKELEQLPALAGHNIKRYDLPVLDKLYGFKYEGEVWDTLTASKVIWPDLAVRDSKARKVKGALIGRHSLKAWGYRLGYFKGDYGEQENAWEVYTPEMGVYCQDDVIVNIKLLELIQRKQLPADVWQMEQELSYQLHLQQERGWLFDEEGALKLVHEIDGRISVLKSHLIETFEPTIVQMKTKVKSIPFNPGSRPQIAKRLMDKGWEPKQFTNTNQVMVNEKILEKVDIPEAQMIVEYMMLGKRAGQIAHGKKAWLKEVDENGYLHGYCDHMGCITSRCSHSNPNLGQVPATGKEYGKECRGLFIVPDTHSLLGSDASGLELRCLAHYMSRYDDGAYGEIILEGDIHTVNQQAAGLPTRDDAKTFIYAYLYGAGDAKIGSIIGGSEKEGKRLKAQFLAKTPALAKLRAAIERRLDQQKAQFKFLKGLDGRLVPVRHKHAALNTLLQSAGAIICKNWYVKTEEMIRTAGYSVEDVHIVGFIHDELQIQVLKGLEDEIGKITWEALKQVEEDLGLKIPLDSEYQTGSSWAATH